MALLFTKAKQKSGVLNNFFLLLWLIFLHLKKSISSILLLFILIFPAFLTYTWLQLRELEIKNEVKSKIIAGIDKKELVFFKISSNEISTKLNWKDSKEFVSDNKMYDIVYKKTANDSISMWCWSDNKETNLNKQLSSLLNSVLQKDSISKEKQNKVFKFYKLLYFEAVFSWKPFDINYSSTIILSKKIDYFSIYKHINFPPPKI
jgi:uncharacterized membrane protein